MKRIPFLLVLAFTVAMPAQVSSADRAHGAGLGGNAVTRWVERSLDAVRAQNVATPNAGRLYAMVTVAMYDAVNGIDTAHNHGREYALVPPEGAPRTAQRDAAAATAAHAVLSSILKTDQPPVAGGVLDTALAAELQAAGGADAPPVAAGRDWGRYVGHEVVARRSADGTQAAEIIPKCSRLNDPLPPCEPGEFHADFDARWRNMTPFGIATLRPYLSPAPPALTSAEYRAALDDVRTCGSNSPVLDSMCDDPTTPAERSEISTFWLAEAGTVREAGSWFQAALSIAEQQGTVDSVSETARLFALVGEAVADAVKLSWETKATYFTWRPQYAINAVAPGTEWRTRIGTVGGSPEYNSGTSTIAGAAEEAGRSRIFQGIHFQFSNEDGRRAGRAIGTEIVTTQLQPIHGGGKAQPCR